MAGAFRTQFSVSFRGEPGSKSLRPRLPLTLVYKGAFDPNQDVWYSQYKVSEQEALHLQVCGHIVKDFGFGSHFRPWSFRPEGLQVLEFGIWGLGPCGLGSRIQTLGTSRRKMDTDEEASPSLQTPRSMAKRTKAVIEVLLSRCPKMRNRQSCIETATNP